MPPWPSMRDPDADPDDRYDAAIALLEWLAADGFPPAGMTVNEALAEAMAMVWGRPAGARRWEGTLDDGAWVYLDPEPDDADLDTGP